MEEKIKKDIISKSDQETQKIAADLAKKLKGGEILALTGDLGGGKTTFVQGLAKGLGIKKQITSPSFVIIKEYKIRKSEIRSTKSETNSNDQNSKLQKLIHIDLYRLKKVDKILLQEIREYFKPENICVIEWAEKIKDALPKNTQWLEFDFVDENTRKIVFK